MNLAESSVVREFHRLYYDGTAGGQRPYERTTWMGIPCLKCPMDLWCYQEIVFEVRPDLVIETGSFMGGSALYLAHLFDILGSGRIVSIDVDPRPKPAHQRITFLHGSSTAPGIVEQVVRMAGEAARVLVILDSDHAAAHVSRELELYAPLVTRDSYLIVEDTNVNGNPVHPGYGPGPREALQHFLGTHPGFQVDRSREKFMLTFNPGGFLRRSATAAAGTGAMPDEAAAETPSEEPQAAGIGGGNEREFEALQDELRKVNAAFRESMAQLSVANQANEGFTAAVAKLVERDAEAAQAARRIEDQEREITELGRRLRLARAGAAASDAAWLEPGDCTASTAPARDGDSSVYEGRIDLRVKNNSHTIALDFIADAAQGARWRLLEAGCGAGHFGEAARLAGHTVWGIEASPRAAAIARGRLDRVFRGSVEECLEKGLREEDRFDCITFGDVLEHLVDPLTVLRRSMEALASGGILVASIPNISHAAVRLMLLDGRWDTSDRGILDRTHLHFFTKASIVDLFTEAGCWIEAIAPVRLPVEAAGIEVDPAMLEGVGRTFTDDGADVFQYVVLARPASEDRPASANRRFLAANARRVLCLMPVLDWSLGDIRLKNPLRKWAERHGGLVRFQWIGACTGPDLMWAHTVVLQREADPSVIELVAILKRYGKQVVFDIDDLLTEIPPFLSSHEHSVRARPMLEKVLGMVDVVTVTTQRLRERLLPLQRSIVVAPNCPLPSGAEARHDEAVQEITLLVASTDTVRVDFLIPALKMLAEDRTLRLEFIGIGPPGKAISEAGIPMRCVEILSYQEFLSFVAGVRNPVGLIPLDASVFSSCKSPIKFLDYSMAGVVSVCSNVPPYSDVVEHGLTGLLVNDDAQSWYEAVKSLATSTGERRRLAAAAKAKCAAAFPLRRAADCWQEVLSSPVQAPVEAPAAPIRWPKLGLAHLMELMLRPRMYLRVAAVLFQEGVPGLRRRLDRILH
jgi:cephalosporin hydroxylase/2-polyprenyl-3-methyl-5-hydroxy-6-metoxy-1,4-benzoquinol methylase